MRTWLWWVGVEVARSVMVRWMLMPSWEGSAGARGGVGGLGGDVEGFAEDDAGGAFARGADHAALEVFLELFDGLGHALEGGVFGDVVAGVAVELHDDLDVFEGLLGLAALGGFAIF